MNNKSAPNHEMKMTAVQARKSIHEAMELMVDNRWKEAVDRLETARMLAEKIIFDEASYARFEKETKRRQAAA